MRPDAPFALFSARLRDRALGAAAQVLRNAKSALLRMTKV